MSIHLSRQKLDQMDAETLMAMALSKYTIAKDHNAWMPTKEVKEDPKIVALTATLKKQELELDKLTKIITQAQQDKFRKSGGGGKKRKVREQDKWKYVPPADGQPNTKIGPNGRTYHWCLNHLMWCIHSTETCNINVCNNSNTDSKATSKGYSASLTLDDVLASINSEE